MNKIIKLLLCFTLILIINLIIVNGASLSFDKKEVVSSGTINNGVTYENFKALSTNDSGDTKNQNVSYVKADKGSVKIVSYSLLSASGIVGSTVKNLASNYEKTHPGMNVLAAINADYFVGSGNYTSINAFMQEGDLIKFNNHTKYQSLAINNDGSEYIISKTNEVSAGYFLTIYDKKTGIALKEVQLAGQNTKPGVNQTTFYYKYANTLQLNDVKMYEINSPTSYFNLASIFIKGEITGSTNTVSSKPLIATLNEEVIGLLNNNPVIRVQKKLLNENAEYETIVGVGSQPLKNGVIRTNEEIVDQNISFCNTRANRSSIGFTLDGSVIIAAIDGRQTNMAGATLREEAALMKMLGCNDCFNFDGGGSTQLVIKKDGNFVNLNSPSENRLISNAILFVSEDVKIDVKIDNITKTTLDLSYDINLFNNVSLNCIKIYQNGLELTNISQTMKIENLKETGNNFISFIANYTINNVEYNYLMKQIRINTTNKEDPIIEIKKEKPSDFNIEFQEIEDGFKAIITYKDDYDVLSRINLLYGSSREVAIKESSGYIVYFEDIYETKSYEFQIEYYYRIDTLNPVKEVIEEKYQYSYIVEPTGFYVLFENNEEENGFIASVGYVANGNNITNIWLNLNNEKYSTINNQYIYSNMESGEYSFTISYTYNVDGKEYFVECNNEFIHNYISKKKEMIKPSDFEIVFIDDEQENGLTLKIEYTEGNVEITNIILYCNDQEYVLKNKEYYFTDLTTGSYSFTLSYDFRFEDKEYQEFYDKTFIHNFIEKEEEIIKPNNFKIIFHKNDDINGFVAKIEYDEGNIDIINMTLSLNDKKYQVNNNECIFANQETTDYAFTIFYTYIDDNVEQTEEYDEVFVYQYEKISSPSDNPNDSNIKKGCMNGNILLLIMSVFTTMSIMIIYRKYNFK